MNRRALLAAMATAMLPWWLTAFGQPVASGRTVGVLLGLAENDPEAAMRVAVLRRAFQALGWVDGRNLALHFRWAVTADQVQGLAGELVGLKPDVLIADGSFITAALGRETRTIPIVFVAAADPVGDGFVENLARPGGAATGFTDNLSSNGGKWLEFLTEIAPATRRIAVLFDPDTALGGGASFMSSLTSAAGSLTLSLYPAPARNVMEIEAAIADLAREPGAGLIVAPDNFVAVHRRFIAAMAVRHRIAAVYPYRHFVAAGGMMSYGLDLLDLYRRVPSYVDQILKGTKPGELPVQSPAATELVINVNVAKACGLTVPRLLLARADEVIE